MRTSIKTDLAWELIQVGALPPHSTDDFTDDEYIAIALTALLKGLRS